MTARVVLQHGLADVVVGLGAPNLVLKVIARRCAIMGFDKVDDATETRRTIVIGGSTEEYIAGLRAVADGTHPGLLGQ